MDRIGSRFGEHLAGGRFVHEIEGMTRADKIGSDQARIKGVFLFLIRSFQICKNMREVKRHEGKHQAVHTVN